MLPAATPFADQAGRTRSGPPGRYVRHRPETTLLYRLVAGHWPALRDELDATDRPLPAFVGKNLNASWAQRLARVSRIRSPAVRTAGPVRITASLTDPAVLDREELRSASHSASSA